MATKSKPTATSAKTTASTTTTSKTTSTKATSTKTTASKATASNATASTSPPVYSVQALPHVPSRWPGYRFRRIEHKGLSGDFYVRPEHLKPVYLNRLPLEIHADSGKRVLVRKLTPEELERERGQITEVPKAIPCVGDSPEE